MENENLEFIKFKNNHFLFIHEHDGIPDSSNCVIFLNPIFDEKKRSQRFYAQTARHLSKLGFNVLRFDYYGTGDSGGELYDFDFKESINDIQCLIDYVAINKKYKSIYLLGLRIGADLAYFVSKNNPIIKGLILIEPILDGNLFLQEQRMRRKYFYKLNKMETEDPPILINEHYYEDHLGYLLSQENIEFLQKIGSDQIIENDKKTLFFKLNSLMPKSKKKLFENMVTLSQNSHLIKVDCPEFWNVLQFVDNQNLTNEIINNIDLIIE